MPEWMLELKAVSFLILLYVLLLRAFCEASFMRLSHGDAPVSLTSFAYAQF